MLEKVENYIRQWKMLEKGDKVVVGLSGGADSVCLFLILEELRKKIGFGMLAVHVNHGIRGEEAKADEGFVKTLCEKKEIPCRSVSVDIPKMAVEYRMSEEEAGRTARREIFEQAAEEWGGTRIALAHHQDDNAETFFLHLARGSGLRGLGGIYPVNGMYIRPLLCVGRKEIEDYLKGREMPYCIDATNMEDAYMRNRIRNHVIPYFKENINEKTVEHMNRSMDQLREIWDYMERQTESAYQICTDQNGEKICIHADAYHRQERLIRKMILRKALALVAEHEKDLEQVHVEKLEGLFEKQVGKRLDLPYGVCACRTYEGIELKRKKKSPELAEEEKNLDLQQVSGKITYGKWEISYRIFGKEECRCQIPMEDYEELLCEAHKRSIRILMDLVVNHTSDEHNWFIESRKSKDNPYRDYYIWKDPVNGKEPNNWGGVFGGSAWEYDPQTQMYYLHLFSKKQPDLNWENEKVRQEVYDMMKFWCEKGIDGFRMDVISMISKDQRFPNGEMNNGLYGDFGPYCVHGPRIHEFLQEMNQKVLSKYDIMTVGETAGVTIEEAQKYAGDDRNELNMVFQFEHVESGCGDYGKWTTAKYDFKEFKNIMIKWQEELQGKAWNSLFLGNHDQPRSVSRFGNDNPVYRETSAKMLATCIHMMQGTPYVYQGEELGMTNIYFDKLEDYRDIESINYFEEFTESGLMTPEHMMKCLMLRSRDNARTPMQWDDSKQAGFTEGEPWIKVNPNYKKINAAQQLEDPDSVFHYYQKLIRLRKEKDIIVYGEFEPLYREDEQIFAYTRKQDQEKLLTVCNFSDKNAEVEVPEEFKGAECLITNLGRKEFEGKIVLNPYEAFVLYYKH